jgi:hypothetical protein
VAAAIASMVKYLLVNHKAAIIAAASMIQTPDPVTMGVIPITVSDNSINLGLKIDETSIQYNNRLLVGMMVIMNYNSQVNDLEY